MPFSRVAALVGLVVLSSTSSAFPITNLSVSNDTFSQLSNAALPQAERDALATAQVLPHLRLFFNQTTHVIEIDMPDVAIQQSIPDSTIDDSCNHKVTSKDATAKGHVLNDTKLSFGISNISWTDGVQVQSFLVCCATPEPRRWILLYFIELAQLSWHVIAARFLQMRAWIPCLTSVAMSKLSLEKKSLGTVRISPTRLSVWTWSPTGRWGLASTSRLPTLISKRCGIFRVGMP